MQPVDHPAYIPILLDDRDPEQARQLSDLMSDSSVAVVDHLPAMRRELAALLPEPAAGILTEPARWAYYPWHRTVLRILGPDAFARLRLDRNRLKIKASEQARLRRLRVGVVGLSTGHVIAHGLAVEGLCGYLRIADFDSVSLSNLNRIPGTIFDIGLNKAVVLARRIKEIDPYLAVDIETRGVDHSNVDDFVRGLDLVVEQCDSFDMKLSVRLAARRYRIPVVMETNDRGLFDVERFDLEPNRPIFHGLLGPVEPADLHELTMEQKTRYLLQILTPDQLSVGAAASMVELDRTIANWPQLGSETQIGAATVAAAVRRFGLSLPLPSGRIRVDLEESLDHLADGLNATVVPGNDTADVDDRSGENLAAAIPDSPMEAVIHAARMAPSGGNSQPWRIEASADRVRISVSTESTTTMDVAGRGSLVALGAAAFNGRVAAARHRVLGPVTVHTGPAAPAVEIALSPGEDSALASLYPAMILRMSNRTDGKGLPISDEVVGHLTAAARAEGARLHLITEDARRDRLAAILAESDRIRYLTPRLHREMISELRWPGSGELDRGLDVRTLGLTASQRLLLPMLSRPEVMTRLTPEADLGSALGKPTADRIRSASGIAIISVDGQSTDDYIRGGAAVERVWVTAQHDGLGAYPVSPTFIFARSEAELMSLSPDHAEYLGRLQAEFAEIVELGSAAPALVLRLTHEPAEAERSRRLARSVVMARP